MSEQDKAVYLFRVLKEYAKDGRLELPEAELVARLGCVDRRQKLERVVAAQVEGLKLLQRLASAGVVSSLPGGMVKLEI